MARSSVELMGLEFEAERLVRSGTSRAEVARLLGVHPQTLAGWALKGGWRKKDLDLERSVAITRRVVGNVARAHAWENEKQAAGREQLRLMQAAFALIHEGNADGLVALMAEVKDRKLRALPGLDQLDEYTAEAEDLRASGVRSIGDVPVQGDQDQPEELEEDEEE